MTDTAKYTRKIGRNRGKPRLWLEGEILTRAGLNNGHRWDLRACTLNKGRMEIMWSATGKRKIAGTPDRPIIDISGGSLDPLAKDGVMPESVTLTLQPGAGCITIDPNH